VYNIYLITNLDNNKKYVGLTKFSITERFYQHVKRGFLLTEAIKKYGEDKFFIELIEEVDTAGRAYELEQYYIKEYNTKVPYGYNLTDGGDGIFGWEVTEEYRQECSERVKQLHKEKKVGMYGKNHSDETKRKMSVASKGKSKPWLIGRKLSPESIEKLRQINLGRVLSDETRKKISENHHDVNGENNPMYGKNHSPETIEKLREKAKNRPKRVWINNGIEEKLMNIDESIPMGYNKGRVRS
jgi:group I intron endonuclease|tara:strand:+ start:278 stop:1003 length:726 start_codon:yes stop_codon:yes gene_type:complete